MAILTLHLKDEGQFRQIIMAKAKEIAEDVYKLSQENLQANIWPIITFNGNVMVTKISDTGKLAASGEILELPDGYLIQYSAIQAYTVEFGCRLGRWVPIEPLKEWATRNLGDEGAAYAIQRKIHDKGISPRPFLSDALGHVLATL